LIAAVNSDCEIIMVDIGEAGTQSDVGVFANGHLGYAMNNVFHVLPSPRQISPSSDMHFQHVFTEDEASL